MTPTCFLNAAELTEVMNTDDDISLSPPRALFFVDEELFIFFDEEIFEEIFDEQAIKKNWKKMTDDERKEAVETRWKHLRATAVDNEVDNEDQKDKIEIDGLNEPVQVIQFVVHPLVNPLGIVWVI